MKLIGKSATIQQVLQFKARALLGGTGYQPVPLGNLPNELKQAA
jgi:hypothetical protein